MKTYRIDNRDYKQGDTIFPQQEYQSKLDDIRKKVEFVLEKNRPSDKPQRQSILMLFQEFNDAKKHWTIQKKSKFYKTDIEKEKILHIGDYLKVEEIFNNINDEEKANKIATEYWKSVMNNNPIVEIFVDDAVIDRIISVSEDERKNAFAIRGGFQPRPNIRLIENE